MAVYLQQLHQSILGTMIHTILLWTVIESIVMLHLNVTLDMYYLDQIQLPAKQMEHGVQVPYAQNLMVIFMLSQ